MSLVFSNFNGPAGLQLGTDDESVPNRLGGADFSLGIIAGIGGGSVFFSDMLPWP